MLTRRALRALTLTALAVSVAGAQTKSPEEILTRYKQTIDPQDKLSTTAGFRTVAKVDMPAQGMTMTLTSVQRRPDHVVVVMNLPGMGEMKQGYDGTTAWAHDPMGGPRLLTDTESKQLRDGADFRAMARDRELMEKVEAAGEASVDGEATDCVKISWKSSRVTTECFSRASGLLLETRSKNVTPQGEIETVTRMSDYKSVGGVMMPHKMVNQMMGMQQLITLTEATAGTMPDSHFELPPEIKALKKP